jgi:thiol-disulfide isomerase/thioredoxin
LTAEQRAAFRRERDLGIEAFAADDFPSAVQHLHSALAVYDQNDGMWYDLACASARAGEPLLALDALEQALLHGWRDPAWPENDPDLVALHRLPEFDTWLHRVRAQSVEDGRWPHADGSDIAASEATIGDARVAWDSRFDELGEIISPSAVAGLRRLRDAWLASAWDALAVRQPTGQLRDRALLEAIKVIAGRDPRTVSVAAAREVLRRADAFAKEAPDSPRLGQVLLIQAEVRLALSVRTGELSLAEASGRLEQELLALLATVPDGEAVVDASTRLMGLRRHDAELVRRLFRRAATATADEGALRASLARDPDALAAWFHVAGLPEFEAWTSRGMKLTRSSLGGTPVLITFGATWCAPCHAELPWLMAVDHLYRHRGLLLLTVFLDAPEMDAATLEAWCRERNLEGERVLDDGQVACMMDIESLPFSVLVDEAGAVVAAGSDLRGEKALLDQVGRLIERTDTVTSTTTASGRPARAN